MSLSRLITRSNRSIFRLRSIFFHFVFSFSSFLFFFSSAHSSRSLVSSRSNLLRWNNMANRPRGKYAANKTGERNESKYLKSVSLARAEIHREALKAIKLIKAKLREISTLHRKALKNQNRYFRKGKRRGRTLRWNIPSMIFVRMRSLFFFRISFRFAVSLLFVFDKLLRYVGTFVSMRMNRCFKNRICIVRLSSSLAHSYIWSVYFLAFPSRTLLDREIDEISNEISFGGVYTMRTAAFWFALIESSRDSLL